MDFAGRGVVAAAGSGAKEVASVEALMSGAVPVVAVIMVGVAKVEEVVMAGAEVTLVTSVRGRRTLSGA
jgi:hypothetical protein